MLALRLWNSLLLVTHSSWAFFAGVFPSFEFNFNLLLLTFNTAVCYKIPAQVT